MVLIKRDDIKVAESVIRLTDMLQELTYSDSGLRRYFFDAHDIKIIEPTIEEVLEQVTQPSFHRAHYSHVFGHAASSMKWFIELPKRLTENTRHGQYVSECFTNGSDLEESHLKSIRSCIQHTKLLSESVARFNAETYRVLGSVLHNKEEIRPMKETLDSVVTETRDAIERLYDCEKEMIVLSRSAEEPYLQSVLDYVSNDSFHSVHYARSFNGASTLMKVLLELPKRLTEQDDYSNLHADSARLLTLEDHHNLTTAYMNLLRERDNLIKICYEGAGRILSDYESLLEVHEFDASLLTKLD